MRIFLATWKNSMELQAVRDFICHFKQSSSWFMGKGENDDLSRIIHLVLRVIIGRKDYLVTLGSECNSNWPHLSLPPSLYISCPLFSSLFDSVLIYILRRPRIFDPPVVLMSPAIPSVNCRYCCVLSLTSHSSNIVASIIHGLEFGVKSFMHYLLTMHWLMY